MSEYEVYEALFMTMDMAVVASMNFVAIVFAYLVAAFVAGKTLPRSVAVGLSVIYTIFLAPHFSGCMGNLVRTYNAGEFLSTTYPESWAATGSPVPPEMLMAFFGIPMIAGWLGSLYYMHKYIRSDQAT